MKTLSKKKIIEILQSYEIEFNHLKYIPLDGYNLIASEIFTLYNAEFAKCKKLVEVYKELAIMLYDMIDELDPEAIVLTNDLDNAELRQGIEQLKSEI